VTHLASIVPYGSLDIQSKQRRFLNWRSVSVILKSGLQPASSCFSLFSLRFSTTCRYALEEVMLRVRSEPAPAFSTFRPRQQPQAPLCV